MPPAVPVSRAVTSDLSYQSEMACHKVILSQRGRNGDKFAGRLQLTQAGKVTLAEIWADAHNAERTREHISRTGDEYYVLLLQLRGRMRMSMELHAQDVESGSFFLYDGRSAYRMEYETPLHQIVLKVPRAWCDCSSRGLRNRGSFSHDGRHALGRIASNALISLSREAPLMSAAAVSAAAESIIDLFVNAVALELKPAYAPGTTNRSAILQRLKTVIHAGLSDYALSVSDIAAQMGVSHRYLNKLLADEETSLTRYILSERLERCAQELRGPNARRVTVSEVANRWGMENLSHFSRSFRAVYGCSPTEYRNAAYEAHEIGADIVRPQGSPVALAGRGCVYPQTWPAERKA